MPWYWTDEIAQALVEMGRLSESQSAEISASVVGIRRSEKTVQEAAAALQDDGEIPLAA
jgi:hypothetical protein